MRRQERGWGWGGAGAGRGRPHSPALPLGKGPRDLLGPHFLSGKQLMPIPQRVTGGMVSCRGHPRAVWQAREGSECYQQGCRVALQTGHRRSLFSPLMATQAPYFLNSCSGCGLSSLKVQQGGRGSEDALPPVLPSPWVLEGQATIAWVLLELDLLQGEDGGSVIELVYAFSQRLEVGVI